MDASGERGKENGLVEVGGPLLHYLAEVMTALKYSAEKHYPPSPSICKVEGEPMLQEVESDWMEDMAGEDEDSGGEESVSYTKEYNQYINGL